MSPIDMSCARKLSEIAEHVRAGDVERILVVIRGKYIEPGARRRQRTESNAAPELERGSPRALQLEEPFGEYDRRRPHIRPVRQTLVLDEIFFLDQIVGVGGLENAVGAIAYRCFLDGSSEPA